MIKVLIADDKPTTLNGFKKLVPWQELNASLVGEATNGIEALQIALETQPDILITDIRMPIMDGLELCKKINILLPGTEIIILSAYDDFSYAQTAIEYGVKDYILKPISSEKMNLIISKIKRLSDKYEKQNMFYDVAWQKELKETVLNAIKSGDLQYINNFFDKELLEIINSQYDLTREICVKLYNLLFDFLETFSISHEILSSCPEADLNNLIKLKTSTGMVSSIKYIYIKSLQAINSKKLTNSKNIATLVKDYVGRSYTNPEMTVDKIARELKFSSNYLSNVFHDITGDNINNYITCLRISKAKEYLCKSSILINDIASLIGYYDSRYFARVFKKLENVTPTEYRNLVFNAKSGESV